METIVLTTKCGKIEGIKEKEQLVFKGIRYAFAKRFERPKLVEKWEGIYNATSFGSCCYQTRGFEDESKSNKAFYYKEFRQNSKFKYSEDCLFLNIYTPINAKECPIVINFHGGAFVEGSSCEPQFDGLEYAKRGVIYVNLNYRINIFGFYASKETGGNFGLYDSVCAINWIYNNIEDFGGDKNNITLMGQSAGAMSVQSLLDSPLINNKISRAIMTSGGGKRRLMLPYKDISKTFNYWENISSQFENIKEASPKDVFYAWKKSSMIKSLFNTAPMVDNEILVSKNNKPTIPCIIGYLSHDIFPFELKSMAIKYAKNCVKMGVECYLFRFDHKVPGDDKINYHSANLWYENGTFNRSWRPFIEEDFQLSKNIIDRYVAFIKTSNPNINGYDIWKPYKTKKDLLIFK